MRPMFQPDHLASPVTGEGGTFIPISWMSSPAGAHGGGGQPARFSVEGGGPEAVWMDCMTPTRGAARRRVPLSRYNSNRRQRRGCLSRQYTRGRPSAAAPLKYEAWDAAMPCRVRAGRDQDIITRKARGMREDAASEMD